MAAAKKQAVTKAAPKRRTAPKKTARGAPPPKAKAGAKPKPKPKPPAKDDAAVLAQIRELEAQLDRMIDEASRDEASRSDLPPASSTEPGEDNSEDGEDIEVPGAEAKDATDENDAAAKTDAEDAEPVAAGPGRAPPPIPAPQPSTATFFEGRAQVFDTAREMLSSDFYLKKWGRLAMRGRAEEVDDFGLDRAYDERMRGVLEFLYTRYFRVQATGIDHVPAKGRCLLVANHSGTLPLDGLMIKTAVKLEHPEPRDVRWLTEDFIYHFPYIGSIVNRLGAVRACQENAERLLANEQLVAVFPEGIKGTGKLFAERYRLQRFGRGGFIKLCLRTGTPIVPVAVVGAEETNPLLFRFEALSKAIGLPYIPVTPTFPALGPLGLLPAPTKWQIEFGAPIDLAEYGPAAADDEIVVGRLAERVRATIQGMLDRAVGARKSVFFG